MSRSAPVPEKNRGFAMDGISFVPDAAHLADIDDVDIVIELIGGSEVALDLCRSALNRGKHVVTANKAMIAHHGRELAICAEEHNAQLFFEAAVAGGIPAIKLLREGLAANKIEQVTGILNGTCNYILSGMTQTGRSFAEVLADPEAEPKAMRKLNNFDVDGIDAAHKLAILAAIAYGQKVRFDQVQISGIRDISDTDIMFAADLGYVIKLLGNAARDAVPAVQPCLVAQDSQLAKIDGALNAVAYSGSPVQSIVVLDPGRTMGQPPRRSIGRCY